MELAVGVWVPPPPVLLLLLVLLAVGVEVVVLLPVVQPDKATARTTTRTAAWNTEALIVFIFVFIFGLPLSFVIHPPRGGNCVPCRKGCHADKHKRLWVLDHMISSCFSSFTLHHFQYSRLKNRHARGEHFLHGKTNQSTPWLTRSTLFRMPVRYKPPFSLQVSSTPKSISDTPNGIRAWPSTGVLLGQWLVHALRGRAPRS